MKSVQNPRVFVILTSFILLLLSCQTEDNSVMNEKNGNPNGVNNDQYLLSVLNNDDMEWSAKGGILLNSGELSPLICEFIISNANNYDPFMVEVVLAAQNNLTDNTLLAAVNSNDISDQTLKSILITQTPLSAAVLSEVVSNRPSININSVTSHQNDRKFICLCGSSIMVAEEVYVVNNCGTIEYNLIDPTYIPFGNSTSEGNLNGMRASGCGEGWTCGVRTESSTVTSDGHIVVTVKCTASQDKCVKAVAKFVSVDPNIQGTVNILKNSNLNSYQKGKIILGLAEIPTSLMSEIIDYRCNLDPFVFEAILLSAGKLSEENLLKLVLDPTIDAELLTNVLIVNTPLDHKIIDIVSKVRQTDINTTYIESFNDKHIAFSLCGERLIAGSSVTTVNTSSQITTTTVANGVEIPMAFAPQDPSGVPTMVDGCNPTKWICGELHFVGVEYPGEIFVYTCTSPPNIKCLMRAK